MYICNTLLNNHKSTIMNQQLLKLGMESDEERITAVALNNINKTALVDIYLEEKIFRIWPADIKLLKPIPNIFISKLIDRYNWTIQSK